MKKPRKSFALWIAGHIVRGLFSALIFSMCALLCWRVFFSGILPSQMKRLEPNAALKQALDANGTLSLFTQEQTSVTRGEGNQGYFGVPRFVFIEQADQVQVVLRYNNGTLKSIREDFGLDAVPPRGERIFDTTLTITTDLTPEDQTDNKDGDPSLHKERIAPTSCTIDTTLLYTYYLLTFDNVELTPETLVVYLDIYFEQDVNYDQAALGTLRLYHHEEARIDEELTRKEQKAINAFGG